MYTLGIDAFSSRAERTGVEWYTYHLLRAMEPLAPPEWRVILYSLATNYESFTNIRITNPNWKWKQLKWLPRRGWGQLRLSWEMLRRPPNVLFVPGAMIPLVHPHRPWRREWTVTTVHDVGFLAHPQIYQSADRRRQELALSFALHHAAIIFVPSLATKESLIKLVHHPEHIVVSPLGISHDHYRPISNPSAIEAVLKKYEIKTSYLLYVGRLDAKKNLPTLIRAFRNFSLPPTPYTLVLIGSRGFGANAIDHAIRESGVREQVKELGWVPEEDLPALYSGATAFVFPSAVEGFGLPVLQALACGTPTVASDIPALREVAGDAALFADPGNVSGWTLALQQITNDGALRTRLQNAGPTQARNFSWGECAKLTWRAIQDLLQ